MKGIIKSLIRLLRLFIYFIIILTLKLGGLIMERILWSDGHVSSISAEEAQVKSHEETTDNLDVVYVMCHNGFEFEWHNNMWMQR